MKEVVTLAFHFIDMFLAGFGSEFLVPQIGTANTEHCAVGIVLTYRHLDLLFFIFQIYIYNI